MSEKPRLHRAPTVATRSGEATGNSRSYRHWTPVGLMTYDGETRTLHSPLRPEGNQDVKVGPVVSTLIETMMKHPEKIYTGKELLEVVWRGYVPQLDDNIEIISSYIKEFRRISGDLENKKKTTLRDAFQLIHTVYPHNYTLVHPDNAMSIHSYHAKVPSGEISYDHDRSVAFSPLVNNGATPIRLYRGEGNVLIPLLKKPHRVRNNNEGLTVGHVRTDVLGLRKKLGSSENGNLIHTIPGKGYGLTK